MLDRLLNLCDRLHAARTAALEAAWVVATILIHSRRKAPK